MRYKKAKLKLDIAEMGNKIVILREKTEKKMCDS